jgi:hypothetical protein
VHRSSDPAARQHTTRVDRRKISRPELHTLRTYGGSDIRAAADEHRSLRWSRKRYQPSRAHHKSGRDTAGVPRV